MKALLNKRFEINFGRAVEAGTVVEVIRQETNPVSNITVFIVRPVTWNRYQGTLTVFEVDLSGMGDFIDLLSERCDQILQEYRSGYEDGGESDLAEAILWDVQLPSDVSFEDVVAFVKERI